SWYRKKFGVEPPAKQLLPTPEPGLARINDPQSRFYVAPDRPVFGGRIIVLTSQDTQSAASDFAVLMQDNRLATIVGTTTGNKATGPTGMTPFKLPHSGLMISLPTEYYDRPELSKGDLLQPDFWGSGRS